MTAGSGTRLAAMGAFTGCRGAGLRVGAAGAVAAGLRPAGFTGALPFDFAREFDAPALPDDGGTARAAKPVRTIRAIIEMGGSATIRWRLASMLEA
jgi:hypothetical protein